MTEPRYGYTQEEMDAAEKLYRKDITENYGNSYVGDYGSGFDFALDTYGVMYWGKYFTRPPDLTQDAFHLGLAGHHRPDHSANCDILTKNANRCSCDWFLRWLRWEHSRRLHKKPQKDCVDCKYK